MNLIKAHIAMVNKRWMASAARSENKGRAESTGV